MINQSQPQQITPDELASKWSNLLNQAFLRIITLEKQLAAQATFIQEMTANEVQLVDHMQNVEAELSQISAEIATAGSAIIADGKEKAAP